MAAFLLDTNVLLWSLASPDQIGKHARQDITSRAHKVYASSLSLMEMAIKQRSSKLEFAIDFANLDTALLQADFELLSFDHWAATQYVALPQLAWNDPFDTAIMAQALAKRLTLVTSDHNILAADVPGLRLLNATV